MKYILFCLLLISITPILSGMASEEGHHEEKHHEDEGHHGHHGGGKAIGEGKAIVEVDEEKGFMLSKEASETIGVKLITVGGAKLVKLPKKALVIFKDKKGVYRMREGFFKFIPARIQSTDKNSFTVELEDINSRDRIAVGGVGLLRVSDIYSTDKSEYGHAH